MNPFARAAEYLVEHGWTQGVMRDVYSGKVCALAAFVHANPELRSHERDRAGRWLARYLLRHSSLLIPSSPQCAVDYVNVIPYWNDRIATSQEEVVATFRAAAETWERENAVQSEQETEQPAKLRAPSWPTFFIDFELDFDTDPTTTVWKPVVSKEFACQS